MSYKHISLKNFFKKNIYIADTPQKGIGDVK